MIHEDKIAGIADETRTYYMKTKIYADWETTNLKQIQ